MLYLAEEAKVKDLFSVKLLALHPNVSKGDHGSGHVLELPELPKNEVCFERLEDENPCFTLGQKKKEKKRNRAKVATYNKCLSVTAM